MTTVGVFGSEEEAALCSGRLRAGGIDSEIVQHSSLDATLLGITKPAAIRVEVADDDLHEALAILNKPATQSDDTPPNLSEEPQPDPILIRSRRTLRILVALDLSAFAASLIAFLGQPTYIPSEVSDYLKDEAQSNHWFGMFEFNSAYILSVVLADVLLLLFIRAGRWLYVLTCGWTLVIVASYCPQIAYANSSAIAAFQWILVGVILRTIFSRPANLLFR